MDKEVKWTKRVEKYLTEEFNKLTLFQGLLFMVIVIGGTNLWTEMRSLERQYKTDTEIAQAISTIGSTTLAIVTLHTEELKRTKDDIATLKKINAEMKFVFEKKKIKDEAYRKQAEALTQQDRMLDYLGLKLYPPDPIKPTE